MKNIYPQVKIHELVRKLHHIWIRSECGMVHERSSYQPSLRKIFLRVTQDKIAVYYELKYNLTRGGDNYSNNK